MAQITQLLHAARSGDAAASGALFSLVYQDLKRLAHGRLFKEGGSAELDTTSLVHESYLRMAAGRQLDAADRAAFFGYMGRVMRSVLVDHVRAQQAAKRGGGREQVTLTTGVPEERIDEDGLLAVDAALDALERLAPQYHRLVELRYFAGLSVREVAELRGVSSRTVEREWDKARAFLRQLMREH
jgi:RNA polymerase sigma factor (TIGR02999 family)